MRQPLLSVKWMDWGEIDESLNEMDEKNWLVYQNGLVSICEHYPESGNIQLESVQLNRRALKKLKRLLCVFFRLIKDDFSCLDGEGWEIVYYGKDGLPIHQFKGYAYHQIILGCILKLVCGEDQSGYRVNRLI